MKENINQKRSTVGFLASSLLILSYLAPTSILVDIAADFPDKPWPMVQMLITMPCLTGVVLALMTGFLTRHFYKRHLIIASAFCYLLGGIIPYFFHQSLELMLLAAAIMGMGFGIRLTCIAALICECAPEKQRGFLMGFQATFICGGGLLFSLLGGYLSRINWYDTYLVYLLVIPVLILEFVCLPKGSLENTATSSKSAKITIPWQIWLIALLGFIVYLFITVFNSNISMLINLRQLGEAREMSLAACCFTFAGTIAGCFTGLLLKYCQKYVFVFTCSMAALGLFLCYSGHQIPALYVGGMCCGAAFSIFTAASNHYASIYAGGKNTSLCLSMFSVFANLGQAISPIMIGWLMNGFVLQNRFFLTSMIFVILSVLLFIGVRQMNKLERVIQ